MLFRGGRFSQNEKRTEQTNLGSGAIQFHSVSPRLCVADPATALASNGLLELGSSENSLFVHLWIRVFIITIHIANLKSFNGLLQNNTFKNTTPKFCSVCWQYLLYIIKCFF